MIYVTSDIHGCFEKYIALLERLKLSEVDTLYILGDIVDRGNGAMKIIKDLLKRNNIVALCGNHDYCASILLRHFGLQNDGYDSDSLVDAFRLWIGDGGLYTLDTFLELEDREKQDVLCYLNAMPIFEELQVGKSKFFLSHTVPEKNKFINFDACKPNDFLFGEPEYEKIYDIEKIIITGHTPTGFIDLNSKGRIWKGNNHIAIDCGAVFGNQLGCLCLDTMEEIYVG